MVLPTGMQARMLLILFQIEDNDNMLRLTTPLMEL
jgi:hypothetical protein